MPRFGFALVALGCLGCAGDAVRPRGGVPTLDDAGSDGFVAVAAGLEHTCGLTADGSAWCWGSNEYGQLGVEDDGTTCLREDREIPCRRAPAAVSGGLTFQQLSAGGAHSCGLATDSRVYCWGDNLRGQVGDPAIRRSAVPVPIATTALFIDVAAGGEHSCALRTDGVAVCWGANDMGQIGVGSSASGFGAPTTLSAALRFASISAGTLRTCARAADGTPFCWGSTWVNRIGGVEVTRSQSSPQRVQTGLFFSSLAVGANTTCGISVSSAAFCWEGNPAGAIGDGTSSGSLTPQPVSGGLSFSSISTGELQTCAVAASGFAYCWGAGSFGELGISPAFLRSRCGQERIPCSSRPERVSGWRLFVMISAGLGNHACGVTVGGNIYCWGAGSMGQRGDGRTSRAEWSPVKTRSPQNVPVIVTENTAP
jgi:hypothetical protein